MSNNTMVRQVPNCPFDTKLLDDAKREFLANPTWKHIYDDAPDGAKRRLEVSFLFSQNHKSWDKRPDMFCIYRDWREEVERGMTEEDLEYMLQATDKPAAIEHYKALLCDRRGERVVKPGPKLMSYDDFFAMLDAQGKFKSYAYGDKTKRSILGDFLPVLEGSGDPLETHVEDILATAKLKEARIYPKDEITYVRVEVQFLTETAEWSKPYQMLATWDCMNKLMGYVFPVGKGRRTELPVELENPENKLQREKRQLLMAERISR